MATENRIRELREARGWSIRELGTRAGLNFNTVFRLETGDTVLNLEQMRRLARAFAIKPSELLSDDDVEIRADQVGMGLVRELERIPAGDREHVLLMAREMVGIVRHAASLWSGGALDGQPHQLGELADIWNGLDDRRRKRAIELLRIPSLMNGG